VTLRGYRLSGRVQGVGFRAFVARLGATAGVHGAVRNDPDGAVTCFAEGDRAALEEFRRGLERGPLRSRVDRVEESELAAPPERGGFDVSF
jgi:acylphosphatase